MKRSPTRPRNSRRATVLLMVVGLLAMLFVIVSAYITLARFDREAVRQVRQGRQAEQIVDSAQNMVLDLMRQSWTDANGNMLNGPGHGATTANQNYSDVSIPGAPATRWLSSNVAIDRGRGGLNGTVSDLGVIVCAPSSLESQVTPGYKSISQLLLDSNAGSTGLYLDPNDPTRDDLRYNVRVGYMDADGDGVPDSMLVASGTLTQLVNAMSDVAVRVPDSSFDPNSVNAYNLNDPGQRSLARQYNRYDDQARYEVAVRVVAHGGMVAMVSPGTATSTVTPWNRQFTLNMLNWVAHPRDPALGTRSNDTQLLDRLLTEVPQQASAIEPVLRRRNMLPTFSDSALPPLLQTLQARMKYTMANRDFGTGMGASSLRGDWDGDQVPDYWQRYNLLTANAAGGGEMTAWRLGAFFDPADYNLNYPNVASSDGYQLFQRRSVMTASNTSDELARAYEPRAPGVLDPNNPGEVVPGIYPGQLKFVLSQITDPATGAFDYDAYTRTGDVRYINARTTDGSGGDRIIRQLAALYSEMLSGYKGWKGEAVDGTNNPTEAVSLREQAYMLAVNTVAFCMPRSPMNGRAPGYMDLVKYDERDGNGNLLRTYVGYSPQPFITQVMAHKKRTTDRDGNTVGTPTALAIELYNPNDRMDSGGQDAQALYNYQYAISLNNSYENGGFDYANLRLLGTVADMPRTLPGRSFEVIYVNDLGANNFFAEHAQAGGGTGGSGTTPVLPTIGDLDVEPVNSHITVKLWRGGSAIRSDNNQPYFALVDQFELRDPILPPHNPNDPTGGNSDSAWFDAYRDTNAESFWGADSQGALARWRCVMAVPVDALGDANSLYKYADGFGDPGAVSMPDGSTADRVSLLGAPGPDLSDATTSRRFGPTIPLYMMNAGFESTTSPVVVHGAARPRNFPTVGFMAFIPRFSHIQRYPTAFGISGNIDTLSMSAVLYDEFTDAHEDAFGSTDSAQDGRHYVIGDISARPPVDFGHMPFFDNRQAAATEGFFKDETNGRLPWGQLVFDYFTTLNPSDPNGDGDTADALDPLRVPGRIDVNTAPWFVLAGVPAIGPDRVGNLSEILPANASALPAHQLPSPAFWSTASGILVGRGADGVTGRLSIPDASNPNPALIGARRTDSLTDYWRLNHRLVESIVSYRDRIRYVDDGPYRDAELRNNPAGPTGAYRDDSAYSTVRIGDGSRGNPTKRGFLSIGELANVKGFDSSAFNVSGQVDLQHDPLEPSEIGGPDYIRAVSLLALVDSHFLTTHGNQFTVYMTVFDRDNPQDSVRSQVTVDRSNMLPKLILDPNTGGPMLEDSDGDGLGDKPVILQDSSQPRIIGQRQVGYFNAKYDN